MYKYLFLIIVLFSCGKKTNHQHSVLPPEEEAKITRVLDKLKISPPGSRARYFIFVPADNGCGGCLNISKQLMNEFAGKVDLVTVVSGYSKKNINRFLTGVTTSGNNIYRDSTALAISSGLINEYPYLVEVNNGNYSYRSFINAITADSVKLRFEHR